MGWERGKYYTRSRKVNGRVIREYVGSGLIANLAAQLDDVDREKRKLERAAEHLSRTEFDEIDEHLGELDRQCDLLAEAALIATGHRQHHRGEWRKQRADKKKLGESSSRVPDAQDLIQRAESGDESVLPAIRKIFDEHSTLVEQIANLAAQVEATLISNLGGKNLAYKEATSRRLAGRSARKKPNG